MFILDILVCIHACTYAYILYSLCVRHVALRCVAVRNETVRYVCMYVCMHACTYVCMYVCMYVMNGMHAMNAMNAMYVCMYVSS